MSMGLDAHTLQSEKTISYLKTFLMKNPKYGPISS